VASTTTPHAVLNGRISAVTPLELSRFPCLGTHESRRRAVSSRAPAWLSRSPESGGRRMGLGPRAVPGRWRVWLAVRANSSSVVRRRQARRPARRQLGMLVPARPRQGARSGLGCSSTRPPTHRPVARARHTCARDRPAGASFVAPQPLHASWAEYLRPLAIAGTGTSSEQLSRSEAGRSRKSWKKHPRRTGFLTCLRVVRERPGSAPAASEPRGALDRRMRIVPRCDWRWLRCHPCHLGWRHADAHNDPISVALCGDPAGGGIFSSPPLDLNQGLIARH
jgi:hypothetical protein